MPTSTRQRLAPITLLLFGLGVLQAPIYAQMTSNQEIIVKGHYENGIGTFDTPSQGVVNGSILEDIPILRPGEVMETVPGLVVTQHSGDGKANQYFLRGYNLDHGTDFSINVDGVPVNMPSHAHGQGYSDLNFLIPELIDRIEYRKGTYFAENGDFSAAGSADVHYRSMLEKNIFDLTYGYYGYQRFLNAASTTLKDSSINLLGAVELLHSDGPWDTPEDLKKSNIFLKISDGNVSNGWSINLSHYQAAWNATDQVPISMIQTGQLGQFSSLDPSDGGNTRRSIISGEWHTKDQDGYTQSKIFYEHYRLQLWSDFTFYENRFGLAPNPSLPSDQFEQVENRNFFGAHFAKGWNHRFVNQDSITELGLQIRHDLINVGLLNTQSRIPFGAVRDDGIKQTSTGIYLKNTTFWSPYFRSILGLREDSISMNVSSYLTPENTGSASQTMFSPKLSLVFGPWHKTEFFISAGKGFHSNDARGVIDRIDPTTGQPTSSTPALVSAFGKEIGIKSELIPNLQSSLSLWTLDSNSEIVYSADSDIGSTSPNGSTHRIGIELNNHYRYKQWLFDADIAWTKANYVVMDDNEQAGNQVPNAIPVVARFGASFHRWQQWSGSIELRYFSSYPLSQDGTLVAPSTTVANFRIQRELTPNYFVSLDILNLLNSQYFDIAYQQDYQISASSQPVASGITIHPGEPRQIRLGLHIRF